jgi:hypothetical protein
MPQETPWAILLCKWSDQDAEPESLEFFRRLFTPAGAGTRNMVEFFDLMSHGNVDVSGSQVFGWYTLPKPQSDYEGNVETPKPGRINRQGLVDLAKSTATTQGVDLTRFYGVVVCMNTPTDLFGGGGPGPQALCDSESYRPFVLGQEMGHGYGLDHSRVAGSSDDYRDPWDVMSTENGCHIASDSNYTRIGPGLNAANMRGRGWLDESRVWNSTDGVYTRVVELRPLHRRDLQGNLAAQAGEYVVEFRVREGWDAAIPRAAILVHTFSFSENRSYIFPSTGGTLDLAAGDAFEAGHPDITWSPYTRVEVLNIDTDNRTASLQITRRVARPPQHLIPGASPFGGIEVDGGGLIVVGGKVVPVPPWDPTLHILELLAAQRAVDGIRDTAARNSVRKAAMVELAAYAERELEQLRQFKTPAAPGRPARAEEGTTSQT